jgi:hypothetical protein
MLASMGKHQALNGPPHVLRSPPDPSVPADAGDCFQSDRHLLGAGSSSFEDMVEEIRFDVRPDSDLFLGDPLFCSTHSQFIIGTPAACQIKTLITYYFY